MIPFLLTVFGLAMYVVALIDWIAIHHELTLKDVLFIAFAPVTIPCKMAVILWVLIKPPFW